MPKQRLIVAPKHGSTCIEEGQSGTKYKITRPCEHNMSKSHLYLRESSLLNSPLFVRDSKSSASFICAANVVSPICVRSCNPVVSSLVVKATFGMDS
jgi:hypothetical protein